MNPYEGIQNLVDQVPALVQPIIVAVAGMIPYIEGEGSAALGTLGGVNPIVAGVAGAVGNILIVTIIVYFGDRIRSSIMTRRAAKQAAARESELVTVGASGGSGASQPLESPETDDADDGKARKKAEQREKLMRWVTRFGVPGASLAGPLVLPTHLTAATLVAAGVRRNWVLLWQVIAIVLWTTAVTLVAAGVVSVFTG